MPSWTMVGLGDGDSNKELDLPDIESGSPEDIECRHVAKVLFKVNMSTYVNGRHANSAPYKAAREAHWLPYNPDAKHAFKEACKLKDVMKPHHILRGTKTCWNSTGDTLEASGKTPRSNLPHKGKIGL